MLKEEVTFESDRVALNDLITRLNRQDRVMQEERLLRW
jgi:hypothetical protein